MSICSKGYTARIPEQITAPCEEPPQRTQVLTTTHRTKEFLSVIKPEVKAKILNSIAKHYATTPEAIFEEVTDDEAEHLLDYILEPLRSEISVLMIAHGMRGW